MEIRQAFQDYLLINYPDTTIDSEASLAGLITIRFNSTENESSETPDRINQGVGRAALIWHKLFDNTNYPIWVIAYEYLEEEHIEYDTQYFLQQFSATDSFVFNEEMLNSSNMEFDEDGNEIFEKVKGKIIIGRMDAQKINIEAILLGIANRDNGIEPAIGQSVYFLDPVNHTGFHMYDDRGFFAWANEADKIEKLYHTHINWIPDYAKEDIDSYFD